MKTPAVTLSVPLVQWNLPSLLKPNGKEKLKQAKRTGNHEPKRMAASDNKFFRIIVFRLVGFGKAS